MPGVGNPLLSTEVAVSVTWLQPSANSLETHEDKLQPKPGQGEHEDHVGEGEAEPGGKVNHIAILRKKPQENRKWKLSIYFIG